MMYEIWNKMKLSHKIKKHEKKRLEWLLEVGETIGYMLEMGGEGG